MSSLEHRYKYAISKEGKPIFIDDITQENRHDTTYTCAGCGRKLFPVLSKERECHFRHEKDSDCSDYNRYLHEYGKAVLKKRFEEGETFIVKYYPYQECKLFDTCQIKQNHNWEKCSFRGMYSVDLKQYYDTCTPEKGFYEDTPDGKKRYVADLKLTSSKNTKFPPTILEVWVNHECTEEKKNSGSHIIEIKIEKEADAWREIIGTDENSELPIYFYGFKDSIPIDPQYTFRHLKAMKTLLEPYPIEVEDSSCGDGLQYDKKALFEVIVSSNNLKDQEYEDIFEALLRMSESNYKAIRFCKYSRNPNFYRCYYLRTFRGWQCPCEHYAFDEEKAKKNIEEIKGKNITFWYSDMK